MREMERRKEMFTGKQSCLGISTMRVFFVLKPLVTDRSETDLQDETATLLRERTKQPLENDFCGLSVM